MGLVVGELVGLVVGMADGFEGLVVGEAEGAVGLAVGRADGAVGFMVGIADGAVGFAVVVGWTVGATLGLLGLAVGMQEGFWVVGSLGDLVGTTVGLAVGALLGLKEGAGVDCASSTTMARETANSRSHAAQSDNCPPPDLEIIRRLMPKFRAVRRRMRR